MFKYLRTIIGNMRTVYKFSINASYSTLWWPMTFFKALQAKI